MTHHKRIKKEATWSENKMIEECVELIKADVNIWCLRCGPAAVTDVTRCNHILDVHFNQKFERVSILQLI